MEKENTSASKTANKTDTSKIYEIGYLLVSSLPDEKIPGEVQEIKQVITKAEGEIISSEDPILIDLAYPMVKVVSATRQKYSRGYFGWVKFEGEPASLETIKKTLDLSSTILRYIIVKTVRENTLLNGKMVLRQEEREEEVLPEDMNDEVVDSVEGEVLDKPIDDLVTA